MELNDTLEMTRRIPCRTSEDRELQERIERCVCDLIPIREQLGVFWIDFKTSGARTMSIPQSVKVNRLTVKGEELVGALRKLVEARIARCGSESAEQ